MHRLTAGTRTGRSEDEANDDETVASRLLRSTLAKAIRVDDLAAARRPHSNAAHDVRKRVVEKPMRNG
jgi:hypothetical protein